MINDHDWAALSTEFATAEPFPSICIDNFLEPSFALELAQSYPDFSKARTLGRQFSTVNEQGKVQITDCASFPDPVMKLHEALSSAKFLNGMQTLSGIDSLTFDDDYAGGGLHMTRKSGILDVHVDFSYSEKLDLYRRLNILIYLNETWHNDWGGEIELWDRKVRHRVKSFSPVLNRCLIFATSDHSFHGVTAVTAPAGIARKSFALYLYNEESSHSMYGNGGRHDTVFVARPNERMKKYVYMPTEAAMNRGRGLIQASKRQVKTLLGREPRAARASRQSRAS